MQANSHYYYYYVKMFVFGMILYFAVQSINNTVSCIRPHGNRGSPESVEGRVINTQ